uniref:PDZ domain-containing protein n=1 Tax=Ascaris lumbricoides TaxID=6252 RepID=A0A0M3HV72_ASCLU
MRRGGASTVITELNARLAVRRAVAEMVADPQHTLAVLLRSDNVDSSSSDPIYKLVMAHLENVYDRIQCEVVSCGNAPPSSSSILKFLQLDSEESSKNIVQRFENRCISARMQEMDEWRRISTSPLDQLQAAPVPSDVPPLDARALASDSDSPVSLRNRTGDPITLDESVVRSGRNVAGSSESSIASMERVWSQSSHDSSSERRCAVSSSVSSQADRTDDTAVSGEQASQLDLIAKTVTARLMNDASFVEQLRTGGSLLLRPPEGILAFERHVVEHMQKTELDALPAILSKPGVIPSVPVVEEEHATITNSVIQNLDKKRVKWPPASTGSSHRSNGNEITCRYAPAMVATADASVGTEWPEERHTTCANMVEVGVNTSTDIADTSQDETSSVVTAEDLSAGQISKKAADSLLQRPGISVVRVRSDGSVVSEDMMKKQPTAYEWCPLPGKIVIGCSSIHSSFPSWPPHVPESSTVDDGEQQIECVSALGTSRQTFSEEDSNNTLAHISPLPQHS